MSLDDKITEWSDSQAAGGKTKRMRGLKKPSLTRKKKVPDATAAMPRPIQVQVARPKRQVPRVVKRTYSFYRDILQVLGPLAGPIAGSITLGLVIWFSLFSFPGFNLMGLPYGVGLVLLELALVAVLDKLYRNAQHDDPKHLLFMALVVAVMIAAAGYFMYRWLDLVPTVMLVIIWFMFFPGPLAYVRDKVDGRSVREQIEAECAEIRAATEVNYVNATQLLEQVTGLVPNVNSAFDKSNDAISNATALIGVASDMEAAIERQVAARLAVEKPALIAQIRAEEAAKAQAQLEQARAEMQAQVDGISRDLHEQYATHYGQPQPAARATSEPTGGLPNYPGASQPSDASHSVVPGRVVSNE